MIDKGQWGWIWPGHRGNTATLYEKCHGIFNDHRESGPRFNVSFQKMKDSYLSKVDRPENTWIICRQYNWTICTYISLSHRRFEKWNHRNDITNPSRAQTEVEVSILSDTGLDQNHKLKVVFVWLERWARLGFMNFLWIWSVVFLVLCWGERRL